MVKGHINRDWSDWLGELAIKHTDDGNSLLSGPVRDQAALYGLLFQLSSLGLQLISVALGSKPDTISVKEGEM
jgi:hypothetical protein